MTAALAHLAANPSELDVSDDPAERMIAVCERAKEWLALAIDGDDIERIAEVKSQAEALRVYAIQKQYGKDAELSAQELVRRAERGMGVAIRLGQSEGRIAVQHPTGQFRGNQHAESGGRHDETSTTEPISVSGYFAGSKERTETYAVTDGVTPEQFEEAITEAKEEQNLSRANVVRKVKAKKIPTDDPDRQQVICDMAEAGHNSQQIAKEVGVSAEYVRELARGYDIRIPADDVQSRTRRIDSNRVVNQLVLDVSASVSGIDLVDFSALNGEQLQEWATSLSASIGALSKFRAELKKEIANRA